MSAAASRLHAPVAATARLARLWQGLTRSQEGLLLLASLIATLAFNGRFWSALLADRGWGEPHTWSLVAGTFLIVVAIHYLLFALPSTRHTIKPWLFALALCSVSATWYMQQYAVYVDAAMLRNVLHTEYAEASELVGLRLLLLLGIAGTVAVLLLRKVRLAPSSARATASGGRCCCAAVRCCWRSPSRCSAPRSPPTTSPRCCATSMPCATW
jgi:lipid A ethanolaminephosphotransferase